MGNFVRQVMLVCWREVRALACTPLFWVLSGVYFLASAFAYGNLLSGFASAPFRQANDLSADVTVAVITPLFWVLQFFLMIQVPLLTMRTIAEERRHGTLALLQTTPLGEWAFVLGKYLANTGLLVAYLLVTLIFAGITDWISDPDWHVVISCYMALVLATSAYVALGLFCSSLSDSQVVAAVVSYVFLFSLLLVQGLADVAGSAELSLLVSHVTIMPHIQGFLDGNIAFNDVAYFLVFTALFLFLTVRQTESLRWRG